MLVPSFSRNVLNWHINVFLFIQIFFIYRFLLKIRSRIRYIMQCIVSFYKWHNLCRSTFYLETPNIIWAFYDQRRVTSNNMTDRTTKKQYLYAVLPGPSTMLSIKRVSVLSLTNHKIISPQIPRWFEFSYIHSCYSLSSWFDNSFIGVCVRSQA